MFIDKTGRQWTSEEIFNKFNAETKEILHVQLELEDYSDDTEDETIYDNPVFECLGEFWREQYNWAEEIRIKTAEYILEQLNKIIDNIGRERFAFNEDGTIKCYIWTKNKGKEK